MKFKEQSWKKERKQTSGQTENYIRNTLYKLGAIFEKF